MRERDCVCVCVCVCKRESVKETDKRKVEIFPQGFWKGGSTSLSLTLPLYVWEDNEGKRERERERENVYVLWYQTNVMFFSLVPSFNICNRLPHWTAVTFTWQHRTLQSAFVRRKENHIFYELWKQTEDNRDRNILGLKEWDSWLNEGIPTILNGTIITQIDKLFCKIV